MIPGFKTRPVVPAKSPTANESGLNAWRGLLSSEFQPHTVGSRQIKLPPYSFLLMSHGPSQSLAAGSQCDVVEKNEQWPQHIQSSVLGSLAAGSVKIHRQEFRFLMRAGLRLFQGVEALPTAMHTHA